MSGKKQKHSAVLSECCTSTEDQAKANGSQGPNVDPVKRSLSAPYMSMCHLKRDIANKITGY